MFTNGDPFKRNQDRNRDNVVTFLLNRISTREQGVHRRHFRLDPSHLYRGSTPVNRVSFSVIFLRSRSPVRRRIRGTRRTKLNRIRLFNGTTKTSVRVHLKSLVSNRRVPRVNYYRFRDVALFCGGMDYFRYCPGLAFFVLGGNTNQLSIQPTPDNFC